MSELSDEFKRKVLMEIRKNVRRTGSSNGIQIVVNAASNDGIAMDTTSASGGNHGRFTFTISGIKVSAAIMEKIFRKWRSRNNLYFDTELVTRQKLDRNGEPYTTTQTRGQLGNRENANLVVSENKIHFYIPEEARLGDIQRRRRNLSPKVTAKKQVIRERFDTQIKRRTALLKASVALKKSILTTRKEALKESKEQSKVNKKQSLDKVLAKKHFDIEKRLQKREKKSIDRASKRITKMKKERTAKIKKVRDRKKEKVNAVLGWDKIQRGARKGQAWVPKTYNEVAGYVEERTGKSVFFQDLNVIKMDILEILIRELRQ